MVRRTKKEVVQACPLFLLAGRGGCSEKKQTEVNGRAARSVKRLLGTIG